MIFNYKKKLSQTQLKKTKNHQAALTLFLIKTFIFNFNCKLILNYKKN